MEIFLVRHAIAGEPDPQRWPNDADRPLTGKGRARFEDAARGLGRLVEGVDRVLSSPFLRTRQTAQILSNVCGWPGMQLEDALAPGANPAGVVAVLADSPAVGSVALVGHEPSLSMLSSYFLTGHSGAVELDFKKGAVLALECPLPVRGGGCSLRWFLPPRALRAMA